MPKTTISSSSAPYVIYDESDEWSPQESLQLVMGAFPAVSCSKDKKTKVFIRFNDAKLIKIDRLSFQGKISFKMILQLSDAQIKIIRKIEEFVLSQLENKIVQRKLLSPYMLEHHFKSNLSSDIMKANCSFEQTVFHSKNGVLEWPSLELPDTISEFFGPQTVLSYVCIQPNLFWISNDSSLGLSWNVKSAKTLGNPKSSQEPDIELDFDFPELTI